MIAKGAIKFVIQNYQIMHAVGDYKHRKHLIGVLFQYKKIYF